MSGVGPAVSVTSSNRAVTQQLSSSSLSAPFGSSLKQQLSALVTETAAVATQVGKTTRSSQLEEACRSMESRSSSLLSSTEESIQKMPAVLSSLEAYLDESISCASDLLHVAPFPSHPPPSLQPQQFQPSQPPQSSQPPQPFQLRQLP